MQRGKASGPDDLCAEHLMYAHPSLVIHLKSMFQLILKHGFVPTNFGSGVSMPLIKDETGDINSPPITLSPVVSKLIEMVVSDICSE